MTGQPALARSGYVLGYGAAERDRLSRQAMLLAPTTERCFRDAGISTGQRVLDLGAGLGDVSLILARLVGRSGNVIGLERDRASVVRARDRAAAVGFRNIRFIQADINQLAIEGPFDAAVGRLVLNHLADPVAVLRSVSRLVRPGGVIAFQEGAWSPTLVLARGRPLWSRLLIAIRDTLLRSGLDPECGLNLFGAFQDAGLPAPHMNLEMTLSGDASIIELEVDFLRTIRPAAERNGVSLTELGNVDTLADRIHAEALAAHSVTGFLAMVSAWARKEVAWL
jgi:SAM-dependent methyltransferase